jgi:hypothetical protein
MKLYSTSNPSFTVLPALVTDKQMEAIVEQLVAVSDFHDANAKKILIHEGREELPPHGFTD